jgi:hypothetical protein
MEDPRLSGSNASLKATLITEYYCTPFLVRSMLILFAELKMFFNHFRSWERSSFYQSIGNVFFFEHLIEGTFVNSDASFLLKNLICDLLILMNYTQNQAFIMPR